MHAIMVLLQTSPGDHGIAMGHHGSIMGVWQPMALSWIVVVQCHAHAIALQWDIVALPWTVMVNHSDGVAAIAMLWSVTARP